MSSLEQLLLKRGRIRNKAKTFMSQINKDFSPDDEDADAQILEEIVNQLQSKQELLLQLNSAIEKEITDKASFEAEIDESETWSEMLIKYITRATAYLKRLRRTQEVINRPTTEATDTRINVKLPRLTIDKYFGDPSTWQDFWAQFNVAIHKNENLESTDKFSYLKSYLSGNALSSVSGLALTDENYIKAIRILTDRFGRKDLIINSHMSKLLNLPFVKEIDDIIALRQLYDTCEIQMRSLESLKVQSSSYGSLLCQVLMQRLPKKLTISFARTCETDAEWNVDKLLKALRTELESRERAEAIYPSGEASTSSIEYARKKSIQKPFNEVQMKSQKPVLSSAAALTAGFTPRTDETQCLFCKKADHRYKDCKDLSYVERKEILKKLGRCYACLKEGHMAKDCRIKHRLKCSTCSRKHDIAVCDQKYPERKTVQVVQTTTVSSDPREGNSKNSSTIYLQTANALAISQALKQPIRCLLDTGSQRTFIREDLSRALNLPILGLEKISIHTFEGGVPKLAERKRVKLILRNLNGPEEISIQAIETPLAITSASILSPSEDIRQKMANKGKILADGVFSNGCTEELSILIGSDYYWKVVKFNIERLTESLTAVDTIFGWTIHGRSSISTLNVGITSTLVTKISIEEVNEESSLSDQLKAFWELDSIGVVEQQDDSHLDQAVLESFESTIKMEGGRYEVRLPWKVSPDLLSDNYAVAIRRFQNLVTKFKADPELFSQYSIVIEDYLNCGIVERVEDNEKESKAKFYLPHRAVIREDRTSTKLRIVFDASSHERGFPSLNECLHQGPNLNPDLFAILLRFRKFVVGFMADIEKAFLQVGLSPEDRDVTRFFWIKDGLENHNEYETIILRMTRVLFGVSSSPFLLAATINYHLSKYEDKNPELVQLIRKGLYVDDLVAGGNDVKEAGESSIKARRIFNDACMPLRKWKSNSKELQECWKAEHFEDIIEGQNTSSESTLLKVLGIVWKTKLDQLALDATSLNHFLASTHGKTKRYILQASSRLFDPVGFISPFTVRVKCLLQQLWVRGVTWDEEIPKDIMLNWNSWCQELTNVDEIAIPRCYFKGPKECRKNIEIHCFSDASEKAYGAVVYVRTLYNDNHIDSNLIASKNRVTPLKKLTLPRLELMAALIGARLTKFILRDFVEEQPKVYYWTDSMDTYYWIRSLPKTWKPFVANRVAEIQALTEPEDWHHVIGKENPADLLTRGVHISNLINNEKWWKGPYFLSESVENWTNWPPKPNLEKSPKSLEEEMRPLFVQQTICSVQDNIQPMLDLTKYSQLNRILRITAWIRRYLNNLKNTENRLTEELTTLEINDAEIYWIKLVQSEVFKEEIYNLKQRPTLEIDSKLKDLNPFLDENQLLRVGGRLQQAEFSYGTRHPIILPENHQLTKLIVESTHDKVFHMGVVSTLSRIRETFWIPRGRQIVKRIIAKCLLCRKMKVKPTVQVMAPLPRERILESPPFHVTGVDFAGPLMVKQVNGNNENIGTTKVYIALLTCAITRAIHLELVSNMSTERFILSLKRFIARRGICKIVFSDNAKTFKKTKSELEKLWKNLWTPELKDYLTCHNIIWKFNVERAPWWGGFFERLVRTVKDSLKKSLGRSLLNHEEMDTTLIEIESMVNSRPITYLTNDKDEPTPLTPSNFLIGI